MLIASALWGLAAGAIKDAVRQGALSPTTRLGTGKVGWTVSTVPLAYVAGFGAVAFIYGCALDRHHMGAAIGTDPHAIAPGADAFLYGLSIASWISAALLLGPYRWLRRKTKELLAAGTERDHATTRYRLLAEHITDLVSHHTPDGRYEWLSPSVEDLLGYTPEQLVGTDPYDLYHPEDAVRIQAEAEVRRTSDAPASRVTRYQIRCHNGDYIWFESLTEPILDSKGRLVRFQVTSRDVTERQEFEDELHRRAHHDPLTGLANRVLFTLRLDALVEFERIQFADEDPEPGESRFAVLYLDLDRFKAINDTLGHAAGDELLVQVADRLRDSTRAFDTVARIGGDEFAVLLEEVDVETAAIDAAKRIERALREPFNLDGTIRSISASIGIAFGQPGHTNAGDVLREADLAAYAAKERGRDGWALFTPALREASDRRCRLEADLSEAVGRGQLVVAYQPIIRLADGGFHGVEALVRWNHPTLGLLAPESFIDIAEETGQIIDLDHWVMAEALDQLRRWETEAGHPLALELAVNCSARDIDDPQYAWSVRSLLAATSLGANRLVVEITESLVVDDPRRVAAVLSALRDQDGVRFAMDDFGTGYSSLSAIHALPVDKIKVDRAFVQRMHEDETALGMVRTVIGFAQTLGMRAVAEGVETPRQLVSLHEMGCEYAQGFLFSRPLTPEGVSTVIREGGPWARYWPSTSVVV